VTDKSRKQIAVLGVLVTILVIVMFVVSRTEGPTGAAGQPSNQPGTRGAPQSSPPAVADVNLEALKAEHGQPAEPERNPFVFRPRPAPPPPRVEAPPPPVNMPPPPPPGPPPPPPIPLKFGGTMEIPGKKVRVAMLTDGQGGTYWAAEGETVLGQYKLLKIGAESVEMSYVDGRGRQTLRLSGR
jgi:hypothetical protein